MTTDEFFYGESAQRWGQGVVGVMATTEGARFLNDQAWYALPDGTAVIVDTNYSEQNEYLGAALYTESEWESETVADYEVQTDGAITFQGDATGWTTRDLVLKA